jgi:hypothetical protein
MSDFRKKLQELCPSVSTLKEIGTHKGLAKLGDTITNTIYSLAKSIVTHRLDQRKVNKKILSNALKQAEMKVFTKNRANSHDMANTVESFIGYMYVEEKWSIEQLAAQLIPPLSNYDILNYKEEIQAGIAAFTILLQNIKEELLPKFQ